MAPFISPGQSHDTDSWGTRSFPCVTNDSANVGQSRDRERGSHDYNVGMLHEPPRGRADSAVRQVHFNLRFGCLCGVFDRRLLGLRDPATLMSTLVLILNCLQSSDSRLCVLFCVFPTRSVPRHESKKIYPPTPVLCIARGLRTRNALSRLRSPTQGSPRVQPERTENLRVAAGCHCSLVRSGREFCSPSSIRYWVRDRSWRSSGRVDNLFF